MNATFKFKKLICSTHVRVLAKSPPQFNQFLTVFWRAIGICAAPCDPLTTNTPRCRWPCSPRTCAPEQRFGGRVPTFSSVCVWVFAARVFSFVFLHHWLTRQRVDLFTDSLATQVSHVNTCFVPVPRLAHYHKFVTVFLGGDRAHFFPPTCIYLFQPLTLSCAHPRPAR